MRCMLIGLPESERAQERVALWLTQLGLVLMDGAWAVPPDEATDEDAAELRLAVDILEPQAVLCLGHEAFELATAADLNCLTLFAPHPDRTRQSDAHVLQKLEGQVRFHLQTGPVRVCRGSN